MAEPFVAYDYVFPVVGGDLAPQAGAGVPGYVIRQVYGTAFCLAEDFFVTNRHVIENASAHPWWGLGFPEGRHWRAVPVQRHESWSDLDIGICSAKVPRARHLRWCSAEQAMLTEVQASGFPYALDLHALTLTIRSFRGTVVAARTWGSLSAEPRVYELSFPCPRGISGAPLWKVGPSPSVLGIIFGNSITEMIVNQEVERTKEGSETIVYEKVEALHLGLAVQAQSVLSVESSLLGMRVGEFLRRRNLLEAA